MNLMHIFTDIPIMIVIITFISSLIFCVTKYNFVNKNLKIFYNFISQYKKSDLNFRFKEIDEWMMSNPYIAKEEFFVDFFVFIGVGAWGVAFV